MLVLATKKTTFDLFSLKVTSVSHETNDIQLHQLNITYTQKTGKKNAKNVPRGCKGDYNLIIA